MRSPEKNCTAEEGSFTWRKICHLEAPMARIIWIKSGSAKANPLSRPMVMGKKQVMSNCKGEDHGRTQSQKGFRKGNPCMAEQGGEVPDERQ